MRITLLLFFAFFQLTLLGQKLKGLVLEPSFHFGQMLDHSPKFTFEIDKPTMGFELSAKFQTFGKNEWEEIRRYPMMGVSFLYYKIGPNDLLGNAYGLVPHATVYAVKRDKFNLLFTAGAGATFIDKTYDRQDNPFNNAVASHVNGTAFFKLSASYRFLPEWRMLLGGSFIHFSNGASKLPNFGINIPTGNVGVQYTPSPRPRADFITSGATKKATKRWGFVAHFNLGLREYISDGGPKYPIYNLSTGALFYLNKVNRLNGGLDLEYNTGAYHFGLHSLEYHDKPSSRKGATRVMLFVADEFLFGDFSFYVQLGAYISSFSYLTPFPVYNKLGVRYFFKPIGKPATRFHFGFYLKSHLSTAEYISFGFGSVF